MQSGETFNLFKSEGNQLERYTNTGVELVTFVRLSYRFEYYFCFNSPNTVKEWMFSIKTIKQVFTIYHKFVFQQNPYFKTIAQLNSDCRTLVNK